MGQSKKSRPGSSRRMDGIATTIRLTTRPSTATRQQKSQGLLLRCLRKCAFSQLNGILLVHLTSYAGSIFNCGFSTSSCQFTIVNFQFTIANYGP